MRMLSFALTEQQFLDDLKDITRRLGWLDLTPGELLVAVRKSQGLKRGERPICLGVIAVASVRRERLWEITLDDVRREGFPNMTTGGFVEMFCRHMKCKPSTPVTRIEFRKVRYQLSTRANELLKFLAKGRDCEFPIRLYGSIDAVCRHGLGRMVPGEGIKALEITNAGRAELFRRSRPTPKRGFCRFEVRA